MSLAGLERALQEYVSGPAGKPFDLKSVPLVSNVVERTGTYLSDQYPCPDLPLHGYFVVRYSYKLY
jgi:hypothetical protein